MYLKAELADGTPFTEAGASRVRKLGIRFICIPIIAVAVSEAVAVWQGADSIGDIGNFGNVVTGVVLLLASMIFRCGAELEKNGPSQK